MSQAESPQAELTEELPLAAEFPTPTHEAWRVLVDKVLKGGSFEKLVHTTSDGIRLEPLATRDSVGELANDAGQPGVSPFTRGAVAAAPDGGLWDVRTPMVHPDLAVAAHHAIADLEGGTASLVVRFDQALRRGVGPGGDAFDQFGAVDGVAIHSSADLARALDGVLLEIAPIVLQPGASFAVAAAWHRELVVSSGVDADLVSGSLGADPIGTLASEGVLPQGLDRALAELGMLAASRTPARTPDHDVRLTTAMVDTGPYVEAGATPCQQLAAVLSTTVAYLRAMEAAGLDVAQAARHIEITLVLDAEVFEGIALLRAARRLWSAVLSSCGVEDVAPRIGVRTAARMMTGVDPWVNLLRVTATTFAAAVGGADSVTALPFDVEAGLSDELGRRMARNTQLVLALESHLAEVVDPAGGSYHLETLTSKFVTHGWSAFTALEASGGIAAGLLDGSWPAALAASAAVRRHDVATRRRPVTGVTEFPLFDEAPLVRPAPDRAAIRAAIRATAAGETEHVPSTDPTTITPLPISRDTGEIEAIRRAAEATTPRPTVFLANLGPIATHTARSTWAKNFFEVGGVATIGNDGFSSAEAAADAFASSEATMACLCSSDARYADLGASTAEALRAKGATRVFLAGAPGDLRGELESAGVDTFVHVGVDLVAILNTVVTPDGTNQDGGSFQ